MGPKIECVKCNYRGQFVATKVSIKALRKIACPICGDKLIFINSKKGDRKMVKARVKKMKAKQKKKASKKASRKAAGSNRPVGRTSGVGVMATWVAAFQFNAKSPSAKRRTDKQIAVYMKREFPGRKSEIFNHVQLVRNRYNKGALTKNAVPKRQSVRHGD